MSQTYKPDEKQIEFANPKASAQNGYEFAKALGKRLNKNRFLRKGTIPVSDVGDILNDYFLYEGEIEARS